MMRKPPRIRISDVLGVAAIFTTTIALLVILHGLGV
jgi:hypothetical protein